jgi:cobalt-zinc-cadmium resistance protein CzcA
MKLKSNLSLEISKYIIILFIYKTKRNSILDSLYQNFSKASNRRFELGETNYLEKITAQAKFRQIKKPITN